MHERGYQFTGDSSISSLTRGEIDILQLGWLTIEEQKQNQLNDDPSHSEKVRMKQKSKNRARKRFAESRGIEV